MAKKNKKWAVYNDLDWVDLIINPPEESREETESYCQQIINNCKIKPEHFFIWVAAQVLWIIP
jgi:hypothetical protein